MLFKNNLLYLLKYTFMKKITFFILYLFVLNASAQESNKWLVGVGINFIDNTNSQDDNYFNVSNWNSTYSISKLTIQYEFVKDFSLSSEFTLNRLDKGKEHNGTTIGSNLSYFGWDLNGRYNVASLLNIPKKYSLEPILGVGFSWTGGTPNQSVNSGLSLGYFFNDYYGIRLQTQGKFAFETDSTVGNNMIQHSLEFILRL